jgi:hypothetical protein
LYLSSATTSQTRSACEVCTPAGGRKVYWTTRA